MRDAHPPANASRNVQLRQKPETLVECFLAQPELDGAKSNLLRTPKSRSPPDLNLAEMIFKFARKKQYARLTDFDILQKTMLAIA